MTPSNQSNKENNANRKQEELKDKTYTSYIHMNDESLVNELFQAAKEKLYNVNLWSNLPGITSHFQMYTSAGDKKQSPKPEVNDYIKINLPGPFPENWVIVTEVTEEKDMAQFTVSPSESPVEKWEQDEEIEHFFIKEATSTFQVERKDNSIYAHEIGKNEGINNEGDEAGNRKLINTILAKGGWAGFQQYQWKKLLDYFVNKTQITSE
ncbi:MAG: hypothetical protein ABJJ05_09780 [Maribacter litoralis]|uniref:hypothetical protein n=1 Tax=Maribacter litoralis TaxID=2059726 RepID=UPI0032992440